MKKLILFSFLLAYQIANSQSALILPNSGGSGNFLFKSTGANYGQFSTTASAANLVFRINEPTANNGSTGVITGAVYSDNTRMVFAGYLDKAQFYGINSVEIGTNAVFNRMVMNSIGDVGIGTAVPASRFEINQAGNNTDLRISSDCGFCSTRLSFISDKATGGWRPGYVASGDNGTFTGRLDFYTNGTGGANLYGSKLGMSIVNGNVGMGTTTPTAPLDVLGKDNWDLSSGSNGDFRVGTNSYNFRIGVAQGGGGAGTVRLHAPIMIFGVGTTPSDKVFMTSTGLGVGTFPTYGFHTLNNRATGSSSYNAYIYENESSDYASIGLFNTVGGVGLYGNASILNVVNSAGSYAPVNASAFNISSDITVKKEVVNLGLDNYEMYISQIRNIQSATYRYNWEDAQSRVTPHIGFIAQSLPEAVLAKMDKDPTKSSETTLGYNLSDMAGLTIMGMKALDAKTQQLEALIKELQTEIAKLKK